MSADHASDIRPDAAPWTLGALDVRRDALITMRALSPPQTVSAVILAFNRADDVERDLLHVLDDDSHPLLGIVNTLRDAFSGDQGLALAAGLVLEADREGHVIHSQEVGTFDWFLRAGHRGPVPQEA